MNKDKVIGVLEMIASDMENDVKDMEGKPFIGSVVADQFGKQSAAIRALAEIVKEFISSSDCCCKSESSKEQ